MKVKEEGALPSPIAPNMQKRLAERLACLSWAASGRDSQDDQLLILIRGNEIPLPTGSSSPATPPG